jgi:hypothetical protein
MGATTGAAISSRKGQRAAPYEGMGVLAQAGDGVTAGGGAGFLHLVDESCRR